MEINVITILVICVLASLAYWVNESLNNVPMLKTIVRVIIVVVAVLLLMQSMGILGDTHSTIKIS